MSAIVKGEKILYGGRRVEIIADALHNVHDDALVIPTDASFRLDSPASKAILASVGNGLKDQVATALQKHGSLRPCDTHPVKSKGISSPNFIFCNVPRFTGDNMKRRLTESIFNCLDTASKSGLKSVAIPTIGCDYQPSTESVAVLRGVADFHFKNPRGSVQKITVVPLTEESMYNYVLQLNSME